MVHEAYLRLIGGDQKWESRAHFFGAAAEAMRRILVDNARRKKTNKHGGNLQRIDLTSVDVAIKTDDQHLLLVDEALERLSQKDPDAAELIKLRYNRTVEALKLLEKEAERARHEAAVSAAIVSFLNEDIFAGIMSEENVTHEMTVATLLDRAASSVGPRFESEPIVEAAVRHTLARTLYTMGRYPEAREQAERAHSIRHDQLGERAEDSLESQVLLGDLLNRLGSGDNGMALVSNALEVARTHLEPAHPTAIAAQVRLAWMHYGIKGHREQCKTLIDQAVSLAREQPDVDPINFIRALHLQARMVGGEEGEALYRESIVYADAHLGPSHPWSFNARGGLAAFLYDTNQKLPEAERLTRQAMLENIRIFGDTHPSALLFRSNLRLILTQQQRWGESVFHDLKTLQLIKRPAPNLKGVMARLGRSPLAQITATGTATLSHGEAFKTSRPAGGAARILSMIHGRRVSLFLRQPSGCGEH